MSDTRIIHPQERLTVILEARQWEQVIQLLHDVMAPLRVTAPLVQAISAQCMRPRTADLHALHPAEDGA